MLLKNIDVYVFSDVLQNAEKRCSLPTPNCEGAPRTGDKKGEIGAMLNPPGL